MYLWLDMHLAHLLPYEAARKMTLKEVITKASKRFSSEAGHIHELFEKLTGKDIGATDKCTNIRTCIHSFDQVYHFSADINARHSNTYLHM